MTRAYVPLWVKTSYSFLEGASLPDEMVAAARAHELPALAVTDRDGVYGLARAHFAARTHGIRLIPGAEVSVSLADVEPRATRLPAVSAERGGPRTPTVSASAHVRLVLLARTRNGYASLCRLLSLAHTRDVPLSAEADTTPRAEWPGSSHRAPYVTVFELCEAAGDVIALCPEPGLLAPLRDAYGNDLYALCSRHLRPEERAHERRLRRTAHALHVPPVAAVEVLYHDRARRRLQDVLTCIRHRCSLSQAGTRVHGNAEHELKSPAVMTSLFRDDPEALARTVHIAEQCVFDLSQIHYRYPAEHAGDMRGETEQLRERAFEGARQRYGDAIPAGVRDQLERELRVIEELDYGGYFLTMHELVRFCRSRDILCQGRGSAANSAVCFCLGITAIDPVRMDLLFERFISRERAEPPDIDLDIEHDRREEVIQHVYEKYGRRHAAMVVNVIRYRPRSAIRDVGKALGFSETDLDSAAKLSRRHEGDVDTALLAQAGLDPDARATHLLAELTTEIQDFPRHLSIHPGGFLLGHEPVDSIVPIEPAAMEGRTVIQWDKDDIDDLGLFKVDLLGLGALNVAHRAFDLMRAHEGIDLDMASVPPEDPDTYAMIANADTVGVFQIESRAQMAMLPRLRPASFYDLVIEIALVRPGPIQGDMVHPYLRRRMGQEPVEYPHPDLERVLHKTLGVPIFQEQVMKLAVLVAGYTPGEADQLRRDMAAWRKQGRLEPHRERLVERMVERGIPRPFAERVFSQIRGFGEYGFPESHAASFALVAYVTAWLKRHHPAAFVCALLNAQPMGFYAPSTLVEDARRHGVEVRPVSVAASAWDCTLEPVCPDARTEEELEGAARPPTSSSTDTSPPHAIRMGLRYVKGLGARDREALEEAPPPYRDLAQFARRTGLARDALVALAEAGAFACFGLSRRDAIWKARALATHRRDALPLVPAESRATFPSLGDSEQIAWDYRSSHHSVRGHPMARFRETLRARGHPDATEVRALPDGRAVSYVGMVICRQRPGTRSGVTFFTLEDETGFANVVLWRPVFDRHARLAKTASLLGVSGRIQAADDVVHIVAQHLWEPRLPGPEEDEASMPRSRDFH